MVPDGGSSLLWQAVAAAGQTGKRAQLEGVARLLPVLAVSGSVRLAAEQRLAAVTAAEQFGDPELAARVIGGFEVPGSWTRSDDPVHSTAIVDAALRRQRNSAITMKAAADADPVFRRWWDEGMKDKLPRAEQWLNANAAALRTALK